MDGIHDPAGNHTARRRLSALTASGFDDTVELLNPKGSGHDGGLFRVKFRIATCLRLPGSRSRVQGLRNFSGWREPLREDMETGSDLPVLLASGMKRGISSRWPANCRRLYILFRGKNGSNRTPPSQRRAVAEFRRRIDDERHGETILYQLLPRLWKPLSDPVRCGTLSRNSTGKSSSVDVPTWLLEYGCEPCHRVISMRQRLSKVVRPQSWS